MSGTCAIGVDYGTNSVRAVVADCSDGRLIGTAVFNYQSGQDVLSYTNGGGVNGALNGTGSKLTLTPSGASATVAQFQAALRNVKYSNTSDAPNTSTRTVSFQADDVLAHCAHRHSECFRHFVDPRLAPPLQRVEQRSS